MVESMNSHHSYKLQLPLFVSQLIPTTSLKLAALSRNLLFWTFSALVGYNVVNLMNQWTINTSQSVRKSTVIIISVFAIFFLGILFISPMAGLLSDIKLGRYKTVQCSSYITLAVVSFLSIYCLMFTIVTSIITPHFFPFLIGIIIYLALGVLMTSSIVLTTSVINFGMDQLHDSSTQDSILFVHWYVWLNYLSVLVIGVPRSLYLYDFRDVNYVDAFRIIGLALSMIFGIISFLLIVSLCVVYHRQRWFLIESSGRVNPYKLVYRVIKFAWHHKIPVRRSAFTYCVVRMSGLQD